MSANGKDSSDPGPEPGPDSQTAPPGTVRQVEGADAAGIADLVETFEDLQTVLRCCEALMAILEPAPDGLDPASAEALSVEGLWTVALLSYARCFAAGDGGEGEAGGVALGESDLTTTQPEGDVLGWHRVLLDLRDHHSDQARNPRERFTVGVVEDGGAASGIVISSVRQPLVDAVTVRQTGAVAYGLSALVNERIESGQSELFEQLKGFSSAELEKLEKLNVSEPQSHT